MATELATELEVRSVATTDAAAICPQGSTCSPAKSAIATGIVRFDGVETNESA